MREHSEQSLIEQRGVHSEHQAMQHQVRQLQGQLAQLQLLRKQDEETAAAQTVQLDRQIKLQVKLSEDLERQTGATAKAQQQAHVQAEQTEGDLQAAEQRCLLSKQQVSALELELHQTTLNLESEIGELKAEVSQPNHSEVLVSQP